MIRRMSHEHKEVAEELVTLQLLAYQIEAELINFYEIPPLNDTIEKIQQSGETFYGHYLNEKLSGVISIKLDKDVMDIHRLMVHPAQFRKGIAQQLLDFVESICDERLNTLIVSTGSKNLPALHFYEKNGFYNVGETKVTKGLFITSFEKTVTPI